MRRSSAAFLVVSLVIIVTAAFVVQLPVFIDTPRDPVSLDERVVVELDDTEIDGDYLLLSVTRRRGTPARAAYALVNPDLTIVSVQRFVRPGEDAGAYFARQREVFADSTLIAAAVGLDAAGYPVESLTGEGVLVADTVPGAPAHGLLVPGDVIVEIDGRPVLTFEDLRRGMPDEVGAAIDVVVVRDERQERLTIETAELATEEGPRAGIGIMASTYLERVELPVPVEVDGGRTGGPSAGLMIALTVYDKATPDEDLAAGRRIAGTGEIEPDGGVRSVGAVLQKVRAAERANADVLLVPASAAEAAEAARRPGATLEIIGVETFTDALEALRADARTTTGRPLRAA